ESMFDHPGLEIDRRTRLYFERDPAEFSSLLEAFRPDQMAVILTAPDVQAKEPHPIYARAYSAQAIPQEWIKIWASPSREKNAFQYPQENPYAKGAPRRQVLGSRVTPKEFFIPGHADARLWFQSDQRYGTAKSFFQLYFSNAYGLSPDRDVATQLFERAWEEKNAPWVSELARAGVSLDFDQNSIAITGFTNELGPILRELAVRIQSAQVTEARFQSHVAREKELQSKIFTQAAYSRALVETTYLLLPESFHFSERGPVLDRVRREASVRQALDYYAKAPVRAIAYGSLDPKEVVKAVTLFLGALRGGVPLTPESQYRILSGQTLPSGKNVYGVRTSDKNRAGIWMADFGNWSPELAVSLQLLDSLWSSAFFDELRTKQQLGYVVGSTDTLISPRLFYRFLVQSPAKRIEEIEPRVLEWVRARYASLDKDLDPKTFKSLMKSVIEVLSVPDKTPGETFSRMSGAAFGWDEINFQRREQELQAAKKLSRKRVLELLKEALNPDGGRWLTVYTIPEADADPALKLQGVSVNDVQGFRQKISKATQNNKM
ncbi:MAG: hypothetical protein KGQ59_09215, partial [Bdellovibrionales bacterium]|nr:hypothetical protein [Bdellovibrionales bacterium]